MSSSDYISLPDLPDLTLEAPAPASEDFVEQTEFPRIVTPTAAAPTPEEAHRSGLAEGEALGRAAALKEMEPVVAELREVARSLTQVRQVRLEELEGELVDLACEVARRILHAELQQPRDAAVRLARACLEEAGGSEGLVLRAASDDVELLRTHAAELELDLADGGVRLVADPRLAPGGVVLETPTRCFDGRPERMLDAARALLDAAPPEVGVAPGGPR